MGDIKELLLQLLFILMPCFLYQFLWRDRFPMQAKPNKLLIGGLLGVASVISMTFPVRVNAGFMFDLRFIPMIVAFLYGDAVIGLLVTGVILGYRLYLGGDGVPYLLLTALPAVLPVWLLSRRFLSYSRKRRMLVSMALALYIGVLGAAAYELYAIMSGTDVGADFYYFFGGYCEVYLVAAAVVTYFIETMWENNVMRREIQQAEKISVIGELAASIAHEIRNPITVTRGFMQLLSESESDQNRRQYVKIALDELNRAESIIRDYLSFAKPQFEQEETVDLGELIGNVVAVLTSYATLHNVAIESDLQRAVLVRGDAAKLSQVFLNMIKNGIEAMPRGGVIHVSAGTRSGSSAVVQIADNGVGMSEQELARLGNPFYSTKDNGTGLGLMVSYSMIHAMNGKIDVKSQPGKGTQFTIFVPTARD